MGDKRKTHRVPQSELLIFIVELRFIVIEKVAVFSDELRIKSRVSHANQSHIPFLFGTTSFIGEPLWMTSIAEAIQLRLALCRIIILTTSSKRTTSELHMRPVITLLTSYSLKNMWVKSKQESCFTLQLADLFGENVGIA